MKICDLFESIGSLEYQARMVEYENHFDGDDGHIKPEHANWIIKTIPLSLFIHIMGSVSLWQEWYNEEIENHDADGNSIADFYRDLITNPIEE